MKQRVGLFAVCCCVLWGCSSEEGGPHTNNDVAEVLEDTQGDLSPCTEGCPIGTSISLDITACGTDQEVVVKGTTTAICLGEEACALSCELEQPCLCGLEERSAERLVCAACTTACGNGLCEPGEEASC